MKMRRMKPDSSLDDLIAGIVAGAGGEEEQLRAFLRVFQQEVVVPCKAHVVGTPVSVTGFAYDGNPRRGLTATCRRAVGGAHVVAVAEIVVPSTARHSRYFAAYRKWMGIEPALPQAPEAARPLDMEAALEVAVLSRSQTAARCRVIPGGPEITLRTTRLWDLFPGEIAVVRPNRQWTYARRQYLSGGIESTRLDVAALGLTPLRLEPQGQWDPAEHYWGEEGEPIDEWAKPIIARGPRPRFEMEQVLPGEDPDDPHSDPILESVDAKAAGDAQSAFEILMKLCQADLRCLDAHAHLGHLFFDGRHEDAVRHYEAGVRIGELSLGKGFAGVLPWGFIDNRPFLRCMHGFGLCLWRFGRFKEAGRIFDRMLWLNPSDNQGVRFLIGEVRDRLSWEDCQNR
jgi:tetratricopeptide (TPR) repeat protein